jgi:thymidylate kinase
MHDKRALTVAFCGIDGSGKSTLAARIAAWISGKGISANFHKARSGRSGIERLGDGDLTSVAGSEGAVMMMTGIAWQSIKDAKPLRRIPRSVLIFDRYTPCVLALCRLYARDMEMKVRAVLESLPAADLTIYVAAAPEIAAQRLEARGGGKKSADFLRKFDSAYMSLPEARSFIVIDGGQTRDAAFEDTCAALAPHL